MHSLRVVMLGAAVAVGAASLASAGEMYIPAGGSIKDGFRGTAVPQPVHLPERASRWYLRWDAGYGFNSSPDVSAPDARLDGVDHTFSDTHWGTSWSVGAGVGYYFSKHLRGDLTLDYRDSSQMRGTMTDGHAYFDDGNGNLVYEDNGNQMLIPGIYYEDWDGSGWVPVYTHMPGTYRWKIATNVFLANLYYDFDERAGFRPYIGAGLGFARHRITNGSLSNSLEGSAGSIADHEDTTFAGALMAGLTHTIKGGWKLDLGYRYLWMGDTQTGYTRLPINNVEATTPIIENLQSHELRAGLRYDIW